ncbi:MAG TPA: UDP-N-acetylglucosamine pyrophosphorylase [Syntrophobacteraceae bacterium]|nr:UDP-N-acetylglucosamine pyrophosphorylase [Syntrophobacteraceae bacterium]
MELRPRSHQKIVELIQKGVEIPNPLTLDIGDEVLPENISGNGVKIYPGCRIYGKETVIAGGAKIGAEGPVTIDNCQVGPMVELKGGYFKGSVFLAKANMGMGAHVRDACILEEEANGAHCVGLKQTILFPFVTLGSLINFCDCFMAGGRSRKDHSEVGSSYIHFNYTPDGDKSTPSLLGDVPRGVMLNQPPIFLGGQGGLVGPLRLGFGNVSVAGTILRHDTPEDRKKIIGLTYPPTVVDFVPYRYPNLSRILKNNLIYLANLVALECWYRNVRKPFFSTMEYGELFYRGVLDKLAAAKKERTGRLKAMVQKVPPSHDQCRCGKESEKGCELHANIDAVCELFGQSLSDPREAQLAEGFLNAFEKFRGANGRDYIQVIQAMPESLSAEGVRWLQYVVDALCRRAGALLSSFGLF